MAVPAYTIGRYGALPVALLQGLRLRATMPRLPPAPGPWHGCSGQQLAGRVLRVCVLGDSIVAGVGIDDSRDALPARFAAALAHHLCRPVLWRAFGRAGATLADLQPWLQHGSHCSDLVLLSAGVNDVLQRRPPAHSADTLLRLIELARRRSPGAAVVVAGLPCFDRFVQIPAPLRNVLGLRCRRLDRRLRQVARGAGACHVPLRLELREDRFCVDRFHPNAASHAEWARVLAAASAIVRPGEPAAAARARFHGRLLPAGLTSTGLDR